ncbi:MAG: M28 family peptidase [candidate division KSB1 bacterium]|nr:M28 family peptidase [candidate division KSB1 bacterium]
MNTQTLLHVLRWRNELEALQHLAESLRQGGCVPQQGDGYVYAAGEVPVLLVAHVDTVHRTAPTELYYDQQAHVLWSPQGLGADDRAGVWAILEVLRTGRRPHVLFTDGEEEGGWGAANAARALRPNVHCVVELDRRGADDAVYYGCGNADIRRWVAAFGFAEARGTFTDISVLCPAWDVAGVNLSVGYYREHTHTEYLRVNETLQTIDRVCRMLDAAPAVRWPYEGTGLGHLLHGFSSRRANRQGHAYGDAETYVEGVICPRCLSREVYVAYAGLYTCGVCHTWWEEHVEEV